MLPEGVFIRNPDKLFIGGEWVAPLSGESIEIESPVSEEIVARVAAAGKADMDRAVAAARLAFDHGPWPTTPPAERGAMMMKFADALERRVPEIAAAWCAQIGGLQANSIPMQMGSVMGLRGIAALGESFAWTETKKGQMVDTAVIVREPVGVVAGIAPWNAPFGIMLNKVAYSLIAGCTVIMKPSPETPLEAYIIAEAAEEAGFPAGVVNLVPADLGAPSGGYLRHPAFERIGQLHQHRPPFGRRRGRPGAVIERLARGRDRAVHVGLARHRRAGEADLVDPGVLHQVIRGFAIGGH